jgi:hypothetical protein
VSLSVFLRVHLWGIIGLGLGVDAGAACRPSPRPSAATEKPVMADTVTLSARNPRAVIPLSQARLAGADVLMLSVVKVVNPRMRPVDLAVGVIGRDTTRREEIGHVALFPSNQPGRFTLRVPASVQRLLASSDAEPYSLVVELLPDSAAGGPDERIVTIGGIGGQSGG